jgi:RNA polymerase sigma-70 factor (ECF subfamily)
MPVPNVTLEDFNSSVDMHSDGVYRFALKHLRDSDTAKDVVQESFARLWQKVEEVDAMKVKSYLFTTAHHIMVDTVRRGQRSTRNSKTPRKASRT